MVKWKFERAGPDRYFMWFDICTLLFISWLGMLAGGVGEDLRVLVWLGWALVLLALFSRKRRDEFAEHCWSTGTSAVFVGLLVIPVLWAFGLGLYDGFTTEHAQDVADVAAPRRQDPGPSLGTLVAILFAIFFARFQWTRFRGGPV